MSEFQILVCSIATAENGYSTFFWVSKMTSGLRILFGDCILLLEDTAELYRQKINRIIV